MQKKIIVNPQNELKTWLTKQGVTFTDARSESLNKLASDTVGDYVVALGTSPTSDELFLINGSLKALKYFEELTTASFLINDAGSFEPQADAIQINVSFTEQPTPPLILNNTKDNPAPTPAPAGSSFSDSRTFPVDFNLFTDHEVRHAFSVGLAYSSLSDEQPVALKQSSGSYLLQRGPSNNALGKGIALVHLNIFKSGNFLTGPSVGTLFSTDGKFLSYFAGWSFMAGSADRFSVNIGAEFASVARLNGGLTYGNMTQSNTGLTSNVNRTALSLSLTYAWGNKPSSTSNNNSKTSSGGNGGAGGGQ